jgi:hypothetical protein
MADVVERTVDSAAGREKGKNQDESEACAAPERASGDPVKPLVRTVQFHAFGRRRWLNTTGKSGEKLS